MDSAIANIPVPIRAMTQIRSRLNQALGRSLTPSLKNDPGNECSGHEIACTMDERNQHSGERFRRNYPAFANEHARLARRLA